MAVSVMDRGAPSEMHQSVAAPLEAISLNRINLSLREQQRPIDRETINELKTSFRERGLIQPVGVTGPVKGENNLGIVYGWHRITAWKELLAEAEAELLASLKTEDKDRIRAAERAVGRWQLIPGFRFDEDAKAKHLELTALDENLKRKELTPEQRKHLAEARVKLMGKMAETAKTANGGNGQNRQPKTKRKYGPDWQKIWMEDSKTPERTFLNWWRDYKSETGVTHTPSKATDAEIDGFRDWCEGRKQEAAAKLAEENQRNNDINAAVVYLNEMTDKYDVDAVKEVVRNWAADHGIKTVRLS